MRATAHTRALLTLAALLIAALTTPGTSAAKHHVQTPKEIIARLLGRWTGRATVTPRGPRPYDITFSRRPDGTISGIARPGNSEHHWTFWIAGEALHLRFLTTFGGNRQPQSFHPGKILQRGVRFETSRTDRLTILVSPESDRVDIDVIRFDRLHVAIRLTRASR